MTQKLLYLASEDWFFVRHFLVMARAARSAGFEVAVAVRIMNQGQQIANEGFHVVPISFPRGSAKVIVVLTALKQLISVIRREKPDIVHCIGLPIVILGGIAARLTGVKCVVLAPTGLGHLWTSDNGSARLLRALVRGIITWLLNGKRTFFVFENREDSTELGLRPSNSHVTYVGGAGADGSIFTRSEEPPSPPVKVAIVGRMLRTKGIMESIQAARLAISRGAHLELHLFGTPDEANPDSLTAAELHAISDQKHVWWHGQTDDVPEVWRSHHIAMLLSYREGLPNSLVEAAACGRPIITCDVAGCRDVVRSGVEGFLVPKNDIAEAAARLAELAADPGLRRRMGAAAYERFKTNFTVEKVSETICQLYQQLHDGLTK